VTQDPISRRVGPVEGPAHGVGPRKADGNGAAFRALLDQLQAKAQRLKEDGEAVTEPVELAGAVDRARVSIDDALSLSDRLLEAYRAAQQRAETGAAEDQESAS